MTSHFLIDLVVIIYVLSLVFIFISSLVQLNLVIKYWKNKRATKKNGAIIPQLSDHFPAVTIQLPLYNEKYVVKRLLDSVSKLDYPKEKLHIQVLDDSTDETIELVADEVNKLKERQFNIEHIQRNSREGYKAGALAYGLQSAQGEFIAIFDSDFLPQHDFLKKTLPYFEDEKVGVVQSRWDHLNRDYSLLTQLQAFGLDAHFSVEQSGRNSAGYFINFNGTAGVWRKSCIENSGGWQYDTLTEDLDLSYRAQLNGWKFKYVEHVSTPAELPVAMNALRTQQFRWNKGAAECAKKNLPQILKQKNLKLSVKINAMFHLMNSTVFLFVLLSALLSVPMLIIKKDYPELSWLFFYATFFLVSLIILSAFYFTSLTQHEKEFPDNLAKFITTFPLFLSMSMGLAFHNSVAVIEGYTGRKTPFKRTPKFNIKSHKESWKNNTYLERTISWMTIVEAILMLYFFCGLYLAFKLDDFGLFPFHLMLTIGFGTVCYYSIAQSKTALNEVREPAAAYRI